MANINQVNISGNLCADPEVRTGASGKSVTKLRIAVNGRQKVGDEYTDRVDYFDVVCFQGTGKVVAETQKKGSKLNITGRLQYQEYQDREGNKRSSVEILANQVEFLTPKS